jgi:hypothetical protein
LIEKEKRLEMAVNIGCNAIGKESKQPTKGHFE